MNKKCTATTHAGHPCRNWSMHGSRTCAAHTGLLGAQAGNQNAAKHAFYRPSLSADEIAALLTNAENNTLDDELAISRVMLRRLMYYLQPNEKSRYDDLTPMELAAIAPLIFTGSRTVAHLLREITDAGRTSTVWDEALDQLARDLVIEL